MDAFGRVHAAIFDELERQGRMAVDAVALTHAVMRRFRVEEPDPLLLQRNPRCANGACDE